ncbi:MAG: hypothetical protein HYW34_03520 [Candidatus Brennerbacteria bacterium]|nr:hypothetical protein [Candidatus Brennerbacteria bacterium]
MVIKVVAVVGFLAIIGFSVYFFALKPAPEPIVQIPIPPTPEQPPEPFITPPVKPGSFFAEAPITRSLPPGFEFQKTGDGEESFETLSIASELPTPEELTAKELEKIGIDPFLIRKLPEIQWPTFEEIAKLENIEIPSEPAQKQADILIQNFTKSLLTNGIIDSSEQKEILNVSLSASKKEIELLNQISLENFESGNKELDAVLNFSENYIDSLIQQGLLAPEEKQGAIEAFKSSAALSIGSQSNTLGPLENLNY